MESFPTRTPHDDVVERMTTFVGCQIIAITSDDETISVAVIPSSGTRHVRRAGGELEKTGELPTGWPLSVLFPAEQVEATSDVALQIASWRADDTLVDITVREDVVAVSLDATFVGDDGGTVRFSQP